MHRKYIFKETLVRAKSDGSAQAERDDVKYFNSYHEIAKYLGVTYKTLLTARKNADRGVYAYSKLGFRMPNIIIEKIPKNLRNPPKRPYRHDPEKYKNYQELYRQYHLRRKI